MSIRALFKALLESNTQTISKKSSAEIAFSTWEKQQQTFDVSNQNLADSYNDIYHAPRIAKQAIYDAYMAEKEELTTNYYKTRKDINKIISQQLPEELLVPDTKVYTKYYLPSYTQFGM